MVTPSSKLVEIREALLGQLGDPTELGADTVLWQGESAETSPAASIIARPMFRLPARRLAGFEGEPMIEQTGGFAVEWLFPPGVSPNAVHDILEATAKRFPQMTLPADVKIFGEATIDRRGEENGRQVWAVVVPWMRTARERNAATQSVTTLQTPLDAQLAVREVWRSRMEIAVPSESWPGLPTRYDYLPDLPTAPALPWCGYWIAAKLILPSESQGATAQVQGRVLVQLHTTPRGLVPTLQILERAIAEHNCFAKGVSIGPVQLEAQSRSPASTLQTNLRIPFRFERERL